SVGELELQDVFDIVLGNEIGGVRELTVLRPEDPGQTVGCRIPNHDGAVTDLHEHRPAWTENGSQEGAGEIGSGSALCLRYGGKVRAEAAQPIVDLLAAQTLPG